MWILVLSEWELMLHMLLQKLLLLSDLAHVDQSVEVNQNAKELINLPIF